MRPSVRLLRRPVVVLPLAYLAACAVVGSLHATGAELGRRGALGLTALDALLAILVFVPGQLALAPFHDSLDDVPRLHAVVVSMALWLVAAALLGLALDATLRASRRRRGRGAPRRGHP